jgi:hypothetical protein
MSPGRALHGSPCRRMRENRKRQDERRRRPIRGKSSGGCGRKLTLHSPSKDGRRDLGEWANNCRRMRDLKGCNVGAVVDGERVNLVSSKSEKSRVVPLGNVSRRRVKIPINVVLVAGKGGENKNLGTGVKRRRRGGGREERQRRRKIFDRIHNNIVFFVATLAGRESQRQVDNNGDNDQADDADGRALCVDGDRRERSGGEGDDGNDDSCLSDRLGFNFGGEFHERSRRRRGRS